jgi:hypothetical protein
MTFFFSKIKIRGELWRFLYTAVYQNETGKRRRREEKRRARQRAGTSLATDVDLYPTSSSLLSSIQSPPHTYYTLCSSSPLRILFFFWFPYMPPPNVLRRVPTSWAFSLFQKKQQHALLLVSFPWRRIDSPVIALATAVLCHRVYRIPTGGKRKAAKQSASLFFGCCVTNDCVGGTDTHTQFNIEMCFHLFMPGKQNFTFFSIEKYNGGKYRSKIKNPRLFPLFFSLSYSAVNGIVNVWSRTYICVPHLIYSVSCQSTIW